VSAVLDAYPDWQIPAHVIAVVPTADRQKATVLVRIGFKQLDPRILPDMGVKVTFLRESDTAADAASTGASAQAVTLVPQAAVKTDSGTTFVFLITSNTVERRAVKTGGTDGDRVEVLAGLKGGDRVVISPPPELAPGKLIEIKQ
jgi:multidrug efflux pump subunit AcrA (membrane-fusion protein)